MLYVPPPAELEAGLRGIIGAVAGDADLTDTQRRSLQAVLAHVFESDLEVDRLAPIDAGQLAAAVTEPPMRRQLIDAMLAVWMMRHPLDEVGFQRIHGYARALDVDEKLLRAARQQLEDHRRLVLVDFARASWQGEQLERMLEDDAGALAREMRALIRQKEAPEVAERWRRLADCPEGSWGQELHRFYDRHGFKLPGEAGAPPEVITYHDWVHVLARYDAIAVGEILVGAFMAANMHDDLAFSVMFLPMTIYETGIVPDNPIVTGHEGSLEKADAFDALGDALRRGRESPIDVLNMDHFAMAEVPLEEARDQLQLAPKREHSIADLPGEPGSAASGRG